jgi:hypothetical protein
MPMGEQAEAEAGHGRRAQRARFADALHHANCRSCASMVSFDDHGVVRRTNQFNLAPQVFVTAGS